MNEFVTLLSTYRAEGHLFRALRTTPTRVYVDRKPLKGNQRFYVNRQGFFDAGKVIPTRDEAHYDAIVKAWGDRLQAVQQAEAHCRDVCRKAHERFAEAIK